jgi:hypothetical protein
MSNTYVLVNPYVQGKFNNNTKSKNSAEAAKHFYKGLSEHFNNAVPKFYFTIQKGGSGKGKYYHFKVKEQMNDDNVNFTIQPYELIGEADMESFDNKLSKFKNKLLQIGGKKKGKKSSKKASKKSYDDDSSDESSDDYKRESTILSVGNQPIYYWWYDPSIYRLESYYIPTFYSYITPIVEISLP